MSGDRIRLEVKERDADSLGSRRVRRLRKDGLIPGVLYGKGHTRPLIVGERDLRVALTGASGLHAIVDVVFAGQTTPHHAVLKDYQRHAVKGFITHVDFHEVRLDQAIQASVAILLVGESRGVKEGGVLQQVTREIIIEALPGGIPEHIEVDISALEIGDNLRLESIAAIEGVTFLDDPHETVIASCTAPRGLEEEAEEEAEAAEGEDGAESAGDDGSSGDTDSSEE